MLRSLLLLVFCVVLLSLPGCGGRHAAEPDQAGTPSSTSPVPNLPLPSVLLAQQDKGVSLYDTDTLKSGAAFDSNLPFNKAEADGDVAEFFPTWDPAGSRLFSDLSYVIYNFHVQNVLLEPSVYLGWNTPPAAAGNFWLGLANFTRDRWDWLPGPAGQKLTLNDLFTDHRAADGTLYVVCLLTGTQSCSLSWMSIGSPGATASLMATPTAGAAPLTVNFDATGSSAPSGVTSFEWDFEGDGTFEDNTGTTGTNSHIYNQGGVHTAWVRITVTGGYTAVASATVMVYNETEDNDDTATANVLPGLATVFTWAGSSGTGTEYPGYDGDQYDYFQFTAALDDSVSFTLTELMPTMGDLDLALLDSDGDTMASSASSSNAVEKVNHTIVAADTAPYFVRVKAYSGYSDYSLMGGLGSPPTAEITATPNQGNVPLPVTFDASASSDPEGPIAKFEWDFNNDGIYDQDTATTATVQHTYDTGGLMACTVRVTDSNGFTDTASATVIAGDIPYDEREDNDDYATANALPAFDFHGYSGSSGIGTGYSGYDGDAYDYFSFNANIGETVTIFLNLDPANGDIDLALYDSTAKYLGGSASSTAAVEKVTYTFLAADTGPFYVRVHAYRGFSDYTLDGIFGAAPTAMVTATPQNGDLPLNVNFDASGSTDDGSIVNYEWDFNTDGTYDSDTDSTATTQYTYTNKGFYIATVRVTDNSGLTATASVSLSAGITYNETEDNEPQASANALPAYPFTGFAGSCGSGTGYTGYDGDDEDFYEVNATSGQIVDFTLTLQPVNGDIDMRLLDGAGNALASSTGTTATEHINYTIKPTDSGPFALRIYKYKGFSDYLLDGTLN